jgi:hypothetical protein
MYSLIAPPGPQAYLRLRQRPTTVDPTMTTNMTRKVRAILAMRASN